MKIWKKVVNNWVSFLLVILGFGSCLIFKSCGCEYGAPPEVYNDSFSNTMWVEDTMINGLRYVFELKLYESMAILTTSVYDGIKCIETKMESFGIIRQSDDVIIMTSNDTDTMLKGTIRQTTMILVNAKSGERICVMNKR